MGVLTPKTVHCKETIVVAQRAREIEYLGEVEFISSNQDVASILTGFKKMNDKYGKSTNILTEKSEDSGSYYQHSFGEGKPCGMPKRIEDTILYK